MTRPGGLPGVDHCADRTLPPIPACGRGNRGDSRTTRRANPYVGFCEGRTGLDGIDRKTPMRFGTHPIDCGASPHCARCLTGISCATTSVWNVR